MLLQAEPKIFESRNVIQEHWFWQHTPTFLPSVDQNSQSLIQLTKTTPYRSLFPLCGRPYSSCPVGESLLSLSSASDFPFSFSPDSSSLLSAHVLFLPWYRFVLPLSVVSALRYLTRSQFAEAFRTPVRRMREISWGRRRYGSRSGGMRLRAVGGGMVELSPTDLKLFYEPHNQN